MKRVFLGNVLRRVGKRANWGENLRDCAYFSTIFNISYPFRHMFWSGSEKKKFALDEYDYRSC